MADPSGNSTTASLLALDAAEADPVDSPGRRRTVLHLVRVLGIAIAMLAVFLLGRTLAEQWSSISSSLAGARIWLLVVAFLLSAVGMWFLALLWRHCLAVFGDARPIPTVTAWYFAGELGKYLPGGIWPVVGRGELARRGGVGRPVAYASTLVSMGLMCVGGALACGLLSPLVAVETDGIGPEMLLLLLVPVGIAVVHPAVFGPLLNLAHRVTRGRIDLSPPRWRSMLGLVMLSVPCWLAIGAASIAVTWALDFDGRPARILFAAVAAWIIGFLAVPVPAGAGIREFVFVALCGLGSAQAIAVAAIARVMLVVVDGLGGVGGLLALRRRSAHAVHPVVGPEMSGG